MTDQPPVPAALLAHERERVIEALTEHFARDHLTMDELELRMDRVYSATTPGGLRAVLDGLPQLDLVPAAAPVPDVARSETKTLFALMSGVVRRGAWLVPRKIRAIAIMGGVEIDLRDVHLPPGVTEVRAFALMGGIVVRVPPNARVEADGFAIMGGFEDQLHQPASSDPGAPVVRITGVALMGGVEATVKGPDD